MSQDRGKLPLWFAIVAMAIALFSPAILLADSSGSGDDFNTMQGCFNQKQPSGSTSGTGFTGNGFSLF